MSAVKPWGDYYPPTTRKAASTPSAARHARLQTRTVAVLDKAATAVGVRYIEGRAVPYNEWTDIGGYLEQIAPGAFTKSLKTKSDLPLLVFHDSKSWPVGVAEKWTEKADGLYGLWRIDVEDPSSAAALHKVEAGLVTGLSIGFLPDPNTDTITTDRDGTTRVTRHAGRLLEVSLVPTPAYVGAQVTKIRACRP